MDFACFLIHPLTVESFPCQFVLGWNRQLARILPDAHPKWLECGAAAVKAQKELEGLAAFVIRAAQKAPGWGTNQFN